MSCDSAGALCVRPETTLRKMPLTRIGGAALTALALSVAALAQAPAVHPITGRRIATVMSHLGADWLDRQDREREEEPDRAIAALAIAPGSIVADVGAGSGYMTVRLAAAVGAAGRVYATDVQPEMISRLVARLDSAKIRNVTTVLATPDDPRLPAAALDLVLMVDVYHELSAPQRTLQQLKRTLRGGGRLVLLEYRKEDPTIPIRDEHKMTVAEAKAELEAEGFRLASVIESLPRQHILIFVVGSDRVDRVSQVDRVAPRTRRTRRTWPTRTTGRPDDRTTGRHTNGLEESVAVESGSDGCLGTRSVSSSSRTFSTS